MSKSERLSILKNMPVVVTFKYDTGFEKAGKHGGKFWVHTVDHKGVQSTITVTELLMNELNKFNPLSGKTVEILKKEIGNNRIQWIVQLPGGQPSANAQVNSEPDVEPEEAESKEEKLNNTIGELVQAAKVLSEKMGYESFHKIPEGQSAIFNTVLIELFKRTK